MEPIQRGDFRDGYTYDVGIKGGDTTFWADIVGAMAVSGTGINRVIRVSADRLHSFLLHRYGDYEFSINVPAVPGATTDQTWGLRFPKNDTTVTDTGIIAGGVFFSIDTNSTFQTISHDDFGVVEATTVTWDTDWDGQQTLFKVRWEQDIVNFLVNDTIIATHSARVPNEEMPVEVSNATASNFDLASVRVIRAGSIV